MRSSFIKGVKITDLKMNKDRRGSYNEIFREALLNGSPKPIQWSLVYSAKNVIRGMRVHLKHYDYTCLCAGKALYVLKDLRKGSPTVGKNQYLQLKPQKLQMIITPSGVAHGFYFYEPSIFVVGISDYYDKKDELGFRYDDPGANLIWPTSSRPILSLRDKSLPSFREFLTTTAFDK